MSRYDDTVDVTPEGVSEGAALSGMFGESTPVETERGIETITEEIIFYKNVGGQAVIEIGRRLTEAKAQLKHGEWLPWLREKVEFSETSAQNFMRIAREYGNTHLVGDLGASKALVLLALPASERENFASEKHLVNGEEKSVSEMSKRELEEAIRQRKLAELKAAETARELDRQKEATAEAEAAAEKAQEAAEAARAEVENAKSISLAAQERTAELEREQRRRRVQREHLVLGPCGLHRPGEVEPLHDHQRGQHHDRHDPREPCGCVQLLHAHLRRQELRLYGVRLRQRRREHDLRRNPVGQQ